MSAQPTGLLECTTPNCHSDAMQDGYCYACLRTIVRPTHRTNRVVRMWEVVCRHDDCGGVVRCVGDRSQALRLAQMHREQHAGGAA